MRAHEKFDRATDRRVAAAIEHSFVPRLNPGTRRELLRSATLRRFRAGQTIVDGSRGLGGITISGVLRVFDATDGDDDPGLTHRNPISGEPVGLGALLDVEDDVWIVALTAAEVLAFEMRVVASLRREDPSFQRELVRELLRRYRDLAREIRILTRGSVQQRLVRELLDRAALEPGDPPLMIHATNHDLAEAVGSRREVVNRSLNDLARRGLLRLGRARISITDLIALREELPPPKVIG